MPLWKRLLRHNFFDISKLADFLELDETQRQCLLSKPRFMLNVPLRIAQKIEKGTLDDPILRQFLPVQEEEKIVESFLCDPVGDVQGCRTAKLLHKYQGRVLLLCTSACAMHCRYCFRQHFDYEIADKLFSEELDYIAKDSSIHEVILSGGDPLSLDDRLLKQLFDNLAQIPHVRKIRFHSRFPVGIPERIDDAFLALLQAYSFQFWFIVHINHPRELDADVGHALKAIQKMGIPVLNQSVLLRGVNDDIDTLTELCERLVDNGISPYYMHQLDRVQGAAHFEVDEREGAALMKALAKRLPGYAIPRYVREIAGAPGKVPI